MGTQPRAAFEANSAAVSAVAQKLAKIWQDVLRRRLIGPKEDFFELGGNPRSAIELFERIQRDLGQAIPPLAIYSAPTIDSLAKVIAEGGPVRFPNAFVLKPGSSPPLFVLHGLGGNVMELFDVVRSIKSPHAIYGLQAKGSDGLETPLDSIEAMADYHLEAIGKLQPHGPYLLCGYSLGGLVALEIARRLGDLGERIALLAIVDSYPHAEALSGIERLRLFLQCARYRLSSMRESASRRARADEKITDSVAQGVHRGALRAWKAYRPKPYSGSVRFIKAESATVFPVNPGAVWKSTIRELSIDTTPGDHHGVLATHYRDLASRLSRYVNEALEPKSTAPASGR